MPKNSGSAQLWTAAPEERLRALMPDEIKVQTSFGPMNVLICGRRKAGKSLVTSAIAEFMDAGFKKIAARGGPKRGILSNYWIKWLQERGPIGRDVVQDENGDPYIADIYACDQEHPFRVNKVPPPTYAVDKFWVFDEFADVVNSQQAASNYARDWGATMRQQRSAGAELLTNTQFPHQVAQGTVLLQIDLIVRAENLRLSGDGYIDLLFYDWHGQITGYPHHGRILPPPESDYDWAITMGNLKYQFDKYRTRQMIKPTWQ